MTNFQALLVQTLLCSSVAPHLCFAYTLPANAFRAGARASKHAGRCSTLPRSTLLWAHSSDSQGFSGEVQAANSNGDQFEKLRQLDARLKILLEKQMVKEETYQSRFRSVVDTMDEKENGFLEKIKHFTSQIQQYRFDNQKSLLEKQEASQRKEIELNREIRTLRFKVQEMEGVYRDAKSTAQNLKGQRDDLEKEVKILKRTYAREIADWEHRLALEREKRERQEQTNRELVQLEEKAVKQREVERIRDRQEIEERINRVYQSQLEKTEQLLSEVTLVAQHNAGYIEQLELERASLRQLYAQSGSLLSTRLLRRVAKYLRKKEREPQPTRHRLQPSPPPFS